MGKNHKTVCACVLFFGGRNVTVFRTGTWQRDFYVPGIKSASLCWRAATTNGVVATACQAGNRFLGSLKGLQLRALYLNGCRIRLPFRADTHDSVSLFIIAGIDIPRIIFAGGTDICIKDYTNATLT
jgi:hypothetical protein